MANRRLEDFEPELRSAIKFMAEFGGLSDDYYAVYNTKYKNRNFLSDLNFNIEQKNYKSIISILKQNYEDTLNFEASNGVISPDEKLVRRTLFGFGYKEQDFFNPEFNKDELVSYIDRSGEEKVYTVQSVFKDNGAYYYNLRDLQSGVQVGGRLRQDEIKKPTTFQYLEYCKQKEILNVSLFNYFVVLNNKPLNEKLELFEAIKGNRLNSNNLHLADLSRARKEGLIDDILLHNTLVMLSSSFDFENNPINLKTKDDKAPTLEDLKKLEKYAIKNMELIQQYLLIDKQIKDLDDDFEYEVKLNPDKHNLVDIATDICTLNTKYEKIDINEIGKLYGKAHWKLSDYPKLNKKIDKLYSDTIEFVIGRDMYNLNRPDLNKLIKDANLTRDLQRNDMTIFRGLSRLDNYEYGTIKQSAETHLGKLAQLDIADNGFRKELYQAPTQEHNGSNFAFCEGDISLIIPRSKDEFYDNLETGIKFYISNEGITHTTFDEVKEEMVSKINQSKIDNLLNKIIDINSETTLLTKETYQKTFFPDTKGKELDEKYIEFLELKIKNISPNSDINKNLDNSLDNNSSINK